MDLVGDDSSPYSGKYPCRVPVWWGRRGEPGPHPTLLGVTGKLIVLRIEKRFTRLEKVLAKLFRAPREVRRPLDQMNSLLWELCDGTRLFEEICSHMDSTFNEDIAPVMSRTTAGIDSLQGRNLLTLLNEPYARKWNTGPGIIPDHQSLGEIDKNLHIDGNSTHPGEEPIKQEDQEDILQDAPIA